MTYMNSTFHSSGTASGNVEMMNRWKPIMQQRAGERESRSVGGEQQHQRHHELDERAADVRQPTGRPCDGRRSSGKLR